MRQLESENYEFKKSKYLVIFKQNTMLKMNKKII